MDGGAHFYACVEEDAEETKANAHPLFPGRIGAEDRF